MWNEAITLNAVWFWTLIVIQSAFVIWFVRTDNLLGSVLSLLSIAAGIAFFPDQWESIGLGDLKSAGGIAFLRDHWGILLAALGSYLLLGLGWAAFRWWLYAREVRTTYERRKAEWLTPRYLLNTASFFQMQAATANIDSVRQRYLYWARVCSEAAARGGHALTPELKPLWKEFVEHGYRF